MPKQIDLDALRDQHREARVHADDAQAAYLSLIDGGVDEGEGLAASLEEAREVAEGFAATADDLGGQLLAITGAQYREAKDAVSAHIRKQAALELDQAAYLKTLRGVPADQLYGPDGEPLDGQLRDFEARIRAAEADVRWCEALVVACGEVFKGESFEDVEARNEANRAKVAAGAGRAMRILAGGDG